MNNPHQNARTTRLGRAEMIRRVIEDGQPVREVARGFGISERTARKWLARFRAEGLSGLDNRSSRPRTVANRTAEYWIGVIEMLRREYRLTAEEIAGKLDLARSTVAAWLTRRGLGRLRAHWGSRLSSGPALLMGSVQGLFNKPRQLGPRVNIRQKASGLMQF
jgi:transposase